MTIDQQSEQKLDQFLRSNQPIAPEPRGNELHKILATIEAEEERRRHHWWKIAVPALVAACLALFMVLPTILHDTQIRVAQIDEADLESFLHETFDPIYQGNGFDDPDMNIGSEWLILTE